MKRKTNWAIQINSTLKRVFDIFISLFILIILLPFSSILIYIITRDGGPAFYCHERVGLNGRKFTCYKFRSMGMNAQKILHNLLANDQIVKAEWDNRFKLRDDPRITKIGRFIRNMSLDELPQLLNVIKGDMSLVGPRPIITEELERYGHHAKYYLAVRPGITGLWQISGRSDISYRQRVRLDVHYAINWTFWQDLVILLKTIFIVCVRKGAY